MWRNFSRKFIEKRAWMALVLPAWVFAGFILAQIVSYLILTGLRAVGVPWDAVNANLLNAAVSLFVYGLTLLITVGLPWVLRQYRTTRKDVGLQRLPSWLDLLLTPAGFIAYVLLSAVLLGIATQWLPFVDVNQAQDVGFSQLFQRYEFVLAFFALVIVAPFAEEVLFRGYLFGKLQQHVPVWLAILITSLLFALVHGAWNVGIDVFALSIVLCLLRVVSGSLWPSILLHMLKNAIAFYFLFINPTFLSTLGG